MNLKLQSALVAAILLALASGAGGEAARTPDPATRPKKDDPSVTMPMVFYLAKGETDACGQGCSEWIAAEGQFDPGVEQRFRSFLGRLGARKLPVFFDSPGGIQGEAFALGRQLRRRGMTAGVSATMPAGCRGANEQTCKTLKQSGQTLPAELNNVARCNSACVYALIGAKVRQVPPGARLGVHSGRPVQLLSNGRLKFLPEKTPLKAKTVELGAQVQQYLKEMGIDSALFQVISKVPHEDAYYLSRDEIARFGIDTREFQESRWTTLEDSPQSLFVLKLVLQAKGTSPKEFRTSMIQLACAGRRIRIIYLRGLASDEVATRTIKFAVADRNIVLPGTGTVSKRDRIDTGGSFDTRMQYVPLEFFEAAASGDHIDIIEVGSTPTAPASSTVRLSTAGLAPALAALRQRCAVAT